MKRLTGQSFAAAMAFTLAGVVVVAVVVVVWATATTGGTRWCLALVANLGGVNFSAQKIEGRLLDHLLLTGVRVDLGEQKVEIGVIELRWKPLLLLSGTIAVNELKIDRVRIQDDTPPDNKPPILAWPRVSENVKLLDGSIAKLRVTDFSYRHLREQPLVAASVVGSVTWQEGIVTLQAKTTGLDLASELNVSTYLSGTLAFTGTPDSYRGDFTFANHADGWREATVSATYQGTSEGIKLAPLSATVLGGSLAGKLDIDWRDGFAIQAVISGKNLNPARFNPDWKGVANFRATGTMAKRGITPLTGSVSGTFLESSLHGHSLTGLLQASFYDNNLSISRLAFQGKGFDLHASGELNRRMLLSARISDLSRLVPGSAGTLQSDGWLRWRDGHLGGALTGSGSKLAYAGTKIAVANLTARFDQGSDYPFHLAASLHDLVHDGYALNGVTTAADGKILSGRRFELDGSAFISGVALHQRMSDKELNFAFPSATASWKWYGETLAGTLSIANSKYNQAKANFQLPVQARFPVAINPKGALRGSLVTQLHENGIISSLFPELVQASYGEFAADLKAEGTWEAPQVSGTLQLTRAGAYLPTAGIHLTDVKLAAHLEKNLIHVDSFRATSGPGHIGVTALLTLADWRVVGYQGNIVGENFQVIYFPELQILSSPKLNFEGTPQKLTLRGEVKLPELHFVGAQSRAVIVPSSDVILEGRIVPPAISSPLALDVQVNVQLGERVFVKVGGIDARLSGGVNLSLNSLDRITSTGEIEVVKGSYRAYGVNLDIVRGRLFFAGDAINRPTLDFLALRTIGDVRAGVTVAGTLKNPVTTLYSEPAMPDIDVLAYIVLGHPLVSSREQATLVVQAAGALLSSSQAGNVENQIKNQFGLSILEIQGGVGGAGSYMGYKALQVTAPGTVPAAQQPGITETMLTVGKYLTPQLYISYGKSLFTGSNLFLLRYDIFKQWQIETQTGSESGADLFYKIEFK